MTILICLDDVEALVNKRIRSREEMLAALRTLPHADVEADTFDAVIGSLTKLKWLRKQIDGLLADVGVLPANRHDADCMTLLSAKVSRLLAQAKLLRRIRRHRYVEEHAQWELPRAAIDLWMTDEDRRSWEDSK